MKTLKDTILEIKVNDKPKGTKKPLTPKAAKIEDPIHIPGFGVVSSKQLRLLPKELQDKARPTKLYSEAAETVIKINIPLLIRILEWAREDSVSDVELHKMVENLSELNNVATMDNYEDILP